MSGGLNRRRWLRSTAAAGVLGSLADVKFLAGLGPVSAEDARLNPQVVRFSSDIEPTVRLLEETPRDALLEAVADRIHHGLPYPQLLAALLLAGVRNVEPRPQVGFKFHAVLVVNSAHLASLASPDEHRWLPIFWALDHFKDSQAKQQHEHPWAMRPANESALPKADHAHREFVEAMDAWDEARADAAVTSLARNAGEQEIFELFFRYGARDFRSIGHKAIFVANSRRTLDCIGWQHAEPVLRSLAFALLMHEGDNPSRRDAPADHAWRANQQRLSQFRPDWTQGRCDSKATQDLLSVLRSGSPDDAAAKVVELSRAGLGPQSIWDALFLGAGELLMRRRGIVSLHAVTTTNALHYAWQTSGNDETRRLLLLQNASFLPEFRQAAADRDGKLPEMKIDDLQPGELKGSPSDAPGEILADLGRDRLASARKLMAYLQVRPQPLEFIDAARALIFLKGDDAHDYKFSSAAFEDYQQISPEWRDRYLASSVYWLRGADDRDNPLVKRVRAALA